MYLRRKRNEIDADEFKNSQSFSDKTLLMSLAFLSGLYVGLTAVFTKVFLELTNSSRNDFRENRETLIIFEKLNDD